MNNILETLNIKGFDVHILISHDAENPLDWGSATLLTRHALRRPLGQRTARLHLRNPQQHPRGIPRAAHQSQARASHH